MMFRSSEVYLRESFENIVKDGGSLELTGCWGFLLLLRLLSLKFKIIVTDKRIN